MLRGERVADAFGTDVERGPDAGGAVDGAGGLAGVGGEVEARRDFGFGVELTEGFGGAAGFVAAYAYTDNGWGTGPFELGGQAEDGGGFFNSEVAHSIDDPEDCGSGFRFSFACEPDLDGLPGRLRSLSCGLKRSRMPQEM